MCIGVHAHIPSEAHVMFVCAFIWASLCVWQCEMVYVWYFVSLLNFAYLKEIIMHLFMISQKYF